MRFLFEGMDELVDGEAASVNVIDNNRFHAKESGFLIEHESSNMLEMPIPGGDFKGKNIARVDSSEHACASPRGLDEAGTMVEELTVRNFDRGNLDTGASSTKEKLHKPREFWHAFFPDETHNTDKQQIESQNDIVDHSRREDMQPASSNTLLSHNVIRTKILSQSGFSQYFVKNTLKGKGVICNNPGPSPSPSPGPVRGQNHPKAALINISSASNPSIECAVSEGLSLRAWLKAGQNKVDKSKSMYIFKQILDLVDSSHSRGESLQALRPSCFKLMPQNQVLYTGSPVTESKEFLNLGNNGDKKREGEHDHLFGANQSSKLRKQANSFRRWPQFSVHSSFRDSGYGFNEQNIPTRENTYSIQNMSNSQQLVATSQMLSNVDGDPLEEQWYASPEDPGGRCSTLASNVYSLGVLLFELLGSFESASAHAIAMTDLRQRILPPSYLSENPREAGFCLWLLHPEPSSRPTARAILQSDLINEIQTSSMKQMSTSMKQMSTSIDQEDAESDLMLHFLASLKEQKQAHATKLIEDIKSLESDILEVESRQPHKTLGYKLKPPACSSPGGSRLINNINHLEHAYFSVRSTIGNPENDMDSGESEALRSRENNTVTRNMEVDKKPVDRLGVFFKGLCKYARYSKFEVRGVIRNGDFSNMRNVICSLGFDRDEDYFATAGVSKKIKVYDFNALLNDSVDIHYPAVEMSNKSRLSSICWNSYIRNYLASADYDGVVKIWDAGTGEAVSHHIEHERRAWSVDFSKVDPIKVASGSDDCSVKLWSINEKKSLSTIKTVANVCCVQFSPYSTHLLSFGSADYRTYCYDLRNVSTPLCILSGHDRAVSYVKFLDCGTLVSASTDNSLKLWDLNKADFGRLSTNSCILTLKGHTNEKNFVGLSVADGYIACGSETNEVFAYYRSLPMPITSHKFGTIDHVSGKETENESNHFVSSVCWRQKSEMVVAANSTGCLKLLQMV